MRLDELLKGDKLHLSMEVFPPKKDGDLSKVQQATEEIAALRPSYISVTYGAGGGTSKYTLEIAKNIKDKYGVPTLEHLTCVSSDKDTIREKIRAMHEAGTENVMALRGDIPPELQDADRSGWDYHYAIELVRELKESGYDFCIGGACYPEVHPESKNSVEDIRHIREKVDAGLDFLVTQMFFDNGLYYSYLYRLREAGIDVPVIPGIMPITRARQVAVCRDLTGGTYMPQRFMSLVDKFGDDPEAMKQAGIIYATDQIIDLYANGIKNVHIYTMNKPDVAAKILDNLSHIIS